MNCLSIFRLQLVRILLWSFLVLVTPGLAKAQYTYVTNGGAITITGYTGSNDVVVLPSTISGLPVTSVAPWAFYATKFANVTVNDSITNIGDGAFFDCESLTNVIIGYSVTNVGEWTFAFCSSLTSASFRGNAPHLGGVDVFYGNLVTVYYLPETLGWEPMFGGHPAVLWNPPLPYNYTTNSGSISITGYTGSGGATVIPRTINFLPVTSISDWAFVSSSLTEVSIPDGVMVIGNYAFFYCSSLSSVTLPKSVQTIGDWAFANCKDLTTITIPNSVTNIGLEAFYASGISSITIPIGVTNIQGSTFMSCFNLTNVTIPETVATVGAQAFEQCYNLVSVTIPNSVITIGSYAFMSCKNVSDITIGESVASMGYGVFSGCTRLNSVIIPDSVINIQDGAFTECSSLTNVMIGAGLSSVGVNPFEDCSSLKVITVDPLNPVYSSVDGVLLNKGRTTLIAYPGAKTGDYLIPNGVTTIGDYAFFTCGGLNSVSMPSSVSSIGMRAFSGCTGLTNVVMGNSVQTIGDWAFANCGNLTSITIPNSLTNIGDVVFFSCLRLNGVYFEGNVPSVVGPNVFLEDQFVTVYYLPGTTGWSPTFAGRPTMLWQPKVEISDGSFGVRNNLFGFSIFWASGMVVAVDACTDLASPSWTPLQTNTISINSTYFSDPDWTNYPNRFYRLRWP